MKIYRYFIGLVFIFALTACNDWLDIQPQDTTEDDQLFETGDGYRNALNGIYAQMASSSMYGKAMTWGTLDAMAQYYRAKNGTAEYYFSDYNYTKDESASIIQGIWSKAYNSIANCNNLIQRVREESVTTFAKGEDEKKLIEGEALALRAILHFDLWRLFASAQEQDKDKKYLPYVESYPCTFQEYISTNEFLKKVTDDLLAAKELVGQFDIPRVSWMETGARFENDHQSITTVEKPDDLFFAFRGYRLNYYAISGMLARVYVCRAMYQEAYNETEIVIKVMNDNDGEPLFKFTSSSDLSDGNSKMYNELIFCLSNQRLSEDYQNYRTANELYLSIYDQYEWFDNDKSDLRAKSIAAKSSWDYYNTKYQLGDGRYAQYAKDMIPMLRLAEMYFIRAEYYHHLGGDKNEEKAVEEIAAVRRGHRCTVEKVDNSPGWFNTALIDEARREFIGEGQLFFYYKHLNVFPNRWFKAEYFVLPYPQNETM